jgi:uncharacterized phiE125 gp8 family phage protein
MARLSVAVAPLELPVLLVEAREQVKETSTTRDAEILRLIYAATDFAEQYTGRALITQSFDYVLEGFPVGFPYDYDDEICLPRSPVQSVTSLKYRDLSNVEQTWATSNYEVDTNEWEPRIVLGDGKSWPDTFVRHDAVTVRFVAGYGGTAKVPFSIQAAILLHVEAHYDKDERAMPMLVERAETLLHPFRLR